MLLDQLSSGRQAKANAEALGGKQGFEDPGGSGLVDAGAGVDHRDPNERTSRLRANRDPALMANRRIPGRMGQRLSGIVDQVDHDLTQAGTVYHDLATTA